MENPDSVQIFLRARPPFETETLSPIKSFINHDLSTSDVIVIDQKPYTFDHIFYGDALNSDVFEKMVSLVTLTQFLNFIFINTILF